MPDTRTEKKSKIAAVVVTYNRKDKLSKCIEAIAGQFIQDLPDIFVVDNGSTDGTEDIVRGIASAMASGVDRSPTIVYENLQHNTGGASGFSHGIKRAVESGYDYVWLMDDDCIPAPDALAELIKYYASNGNCGFLSSKAVWRDGSIHRMNLQRRTVFRNISMCKTANASSPIEVKMASFVSLLVPSHVVLEMGLPHKDFFIYTDDWEFTRRISRRYKCMLIPSSVVVHDTDSNSAADIVSAGADRLDRFKYLYRNDVYLYRREGIKGFCYESARLAWHSLRILKSSHRIGDKLERFRIMASATAKGIGFSPELDTVDVPREVRVLEAFGEPISFGGQERFVMNVLKLMDRTGLRFDFLTPYYCDNEAIRNEVKDYGGNLYELGCRFSPGGIRNSAAPPIKDFLADHKYDVIHIHSGSNSMLAMYARLASKVGIPRIIVHSHSSGINGFKHSASKFATASALRKYPTDYYSCSEEAGEWRFPKGICRSDLEVVNNGIIVEDFKFSVDARVATRKRLGVDDDTTVIACVGRLTRQKNQSFLLEVFGKIRQTTGGDRYKLLLVGSGEDLEMLQRESSRLEVSSDVIFVPANDNIADYYMAADILAMPSLYEGLSIVALEAQAAGLEIIASDNNYRATAFTQGVSFLPLSDPEAWVSALMRKHARHSENAGLIKDSDIDARVTAMKVRNKYIERII